MKKLYRGPYIDALCQVWFHLVKLFQRSRLKYEKLTDGRRTTDAKWWQYLTWPFGSGELKKWWQLNIWPNFSLRTITLPKIIGPEQNVNLICNLSVYTHIPNIKSISQSIVKKKWSELFYFGITDMGNTIHVCPSHLVAGDIKNPDAFFMW